MHDPDIFIEPVTITIEQNADFELEVQWFDPDGAPIDTTGWSGIAHIRHDFDDPTPALELDVASIDGGFMLTASGAETLACDLTRDEGVWDLLVTGPDDQQERLVYGDVVLSRAASYE